MSSHWWAGRKPAKTPLHSRRIGDSESGSCGRIASTTHMGNKGANLSQARPFAMGNGAAPLRWGSFPPHTGILTRHCGTPEPKPKKNKQAEQQVRGMQISSGEIYFQEDAHECWEPVWIPVLGSGTTGPAYIRWQYSNIDYTQIYVCNKLGNGECFVQRENLLNPFFPRKQLTSINANIY